jgi:hypothetical protein
MNPGIKGIWLRGEPIVYGLNNNFPVKLDFLNKARQLDVPEVHVSSLVMTGTNDTTGAGGTTALGRDFAKLFSRVQYIDNQEVVNASGPMLRILRQVELGAKATDPADNASASVQMENRFDIHWVPLDTRALRPRDFAIPVEHFLEGGQFNFTTPAAVPTGWGPFNADWRVQAEFKVHNGRTRELKSQRRIFEQVISQQEFEYPAVGALRSAIIGSALTTTGYTSLAAFTTIFSRTLDLPPTFRTNSLREDYRKGADVIGTNDEFLLATPGAIPLAFPLRAQKIGSMIDLPKSLHIDLLAAAPASGRLLLDLVVDRPPNLAALVMGYNSPGELARAVNQYGEIVIGDGDNPKASTFNATLARRLPIRLNPGRHG